MEQTPFGGPSGQAGEQGPPTFDPPPSMPAGPPPLPPPPRDSPPCPNCGKTIATGNVFCSSCGTPVVDLTEGPKSPKSNTLVIGVIALIVFVVIGAGLFLLSSAIGESKGQGGRKISGNVTLIATDFLYLPQRAPCKGTGGYNDVKEGVDVRLSDGRGSLIASTRLEPGEVVGLMGGLGGCWFNFTFEDVPDVDFYVFSFGSGLRGEVTYSRSQMEDRFWILAIDIGR